MNNNHPYDRIDHRRLDLMQKLERPPVSMRWWIILPLALLLAAVQVVMDLACQFKPVASCLNSTQIPIISFGLLGIMLVIVNPLLRLTRLVQPLNRAEMMTVFAAIFVSAGIASLGMCDWLMPLVAAPFNAQWNTAQRGWNVDIIPHLNKSLFITDTHVISELRQGFRHESGLWQKIPWMVWAKPMACWLVFVFAIYLMFYALSMLLYESWARREKLVFPLAQLPEALLEEESTRGRLPPIMRSGMFWTGFLVVFIVLSYNAMCQAGWTGLQPLALGIRGHVLTQMFTGTVLQGIETYGTHRLVLEVVFTAVGIGFLLPLEVSASIWIYYFVGLFMILGGIWTAAGGTAQSFPCDWLTDSNFVSSLGSGGMLAYSSSYLAKLGVERWAEARQKASGAGMLKFFVIWIRGFGWGGALLLLALAVAVGWLQWAGVSVMWGTIFIALIMFGTIAMMRLVCESGFYLMQACASPFHYAKILGGAHIVPGPVFAVLMPVYSTMFLETTATMAPAVLNSFKMQEDTRASRRLYHTVVAVTVAITVVISVIGMLYGVYSVGANNAIWYFGSGASGTLDMTQRLISGAVVEPNNVGIFFHIIGFGWVILSLLMRRRFFWWLSPIGLILMCNYLVQYIWLGIFIGWACKKLAVRYGGRHMFDRLRPLFIGLIIGEVGACVVWGVCSYVFHLDQVNISLWPPGI